MVLPTVYGHKPEVIVYPKFSVGQYSVTYENGTDTEETKFENGLVLGTNSNIIAFRREDNSLPARIVTAISGSLDKGMFLPFECSLGVIHEKRPPKRFHWLVVSKDFPTTIYLTSYSDIYSVEATPIELVFRLYTADSLEIAEKKLRYNCLEDIPGEFSLRSLFESELAASSGTYGYVSLFSPYGGFFVYSSLKKERSVTLEHSF